MIMMRNYHITKLGGQVNQLRRLAGGNLSGSIIYCNCKAVVITKGSKFIMIHIIYYKYLLWYFFLSLYNFWFDIKIE